MPNRESAVVLLARAIDRLNSERPPARITPALRASLETLGAESPFLARIVLANLWLFEPLLVAAAARHRRDAFEAVDFAMDHLKSAAWFWKRERRGSGEEGGWHWIEPRDADHADRARWDNS